MGEGPRSEQVRSALERRDAPAFLDLARTAPAGLLESVRAAGWRAVDLVDRLGLEPQVVFSFYVDEMARAYQSELTPEYLRFRRSSHRLFQDDAGRGASSPEPRF